MEELYVPTLHSFAMNNLFTGSLGLFRFRVKPRIEMATQKEVDYAYEVMEAIQLAKEQGKGAIALHGKMIDAPIVARAQRTLDMAKALGMERGNG